MWMKPRGGLDASFNKHTAVWKKPILEKTEEFKEDVSDDEIDEDSDDSLERGEDDLDAYINHMPNAGMMKSIYD